MEQSWYLFALLASMASASYNSVNQFFKMPGSLLMVYRGLMVALIILPFMLMHPFIRNPYFYVACVLQGLLIAFIDYRFARAVKAFSASVASAIQPLSIGVIFFVWLIVMPSVARDYVAHPQHFLTVLICLTGIVFAALKLRNAQSSRRAMKYLAPCLIVMAVGDILNKKAMLLGSENLTSAIFGYCFITGVVCGVWNLRLYMKQRLPIKRIFEKKYLIQGGVISLSVILLMAFKNAAMSGTPNPAYVTAVVLIYPLWILLGNYVYKLKNPKARVAWVSPWIIFLLVFCVIVLILSNATK